MTVHYTYARRRKSRRQRRKRRTRRATGRRTSFATPKTALRFVTWNCLSALPQHYHELSSSTPTVDVRPSLRNNLTRHDAILRDLEPHLRNVQDGTTHAIVLQEVDSELHAKLFERVTRRPAASSARGGAARGVPVLSNVHIHTTTKPYVNLARQVAPDHTEHTFQTWFVTLVPKHLVLPASRTNVVVKQRGGRFLVTHTKVATILNVHVPWVPEEQYANKAHKNAATVRTLASFVRRTSRRVPVFVLGDMNHSCPLNQRLYAKYFGTTNRAVGQVTQFGESYKLDKDNIAGKKTFGHIEMTPDDGLVCPVGWRVRSGGTGVLDVLTPVRVGDDDQTNMQLQATMQATALDKQAIVFTPLARKRMPVDANGWFVDMSDGTLPRYPSDHALVEVEVANGS